MKTKKGENKLTLKKTTVVNLENKEMTEVVGGFEITVKGKLCGDSALCSVICPW